MTINNPEYQREWERKNKDKRRAINARHHAKVKAWFAEYKSTLSCACGENHPACLDFHHRSPKTKRYTIGLMLNSNRGIPSIKKEIAKCEVLCANCHRKHHYDERQQVAS